MFSMGRSIRIRSRSRVPSTVTVGSSLRWVLPFTNSSLTPPTQKLALGGVLGTGNGCCVRLGCLGLAAQAAQQVRPDGVVQVVALEIEAVYQGEAGGRAIDLGDGDRAVQRYHGASSQRQQLIVELHDLPPVGRARGRRIAVDGVFRGMALVRPGLV